MAVGHFLPGAKSELQSRQPAMMTLIAMGITVAYGYSLYAFVMNHFIAPHGMVMDFFWELATLIVIMLLGHWIEMNAVMAAGNAVEKLAALLPNQAHVVHGDSVMDMPLSEVQVGTRLRVLAGEQMPADGEIVSGAVVSMNRLSQAKPRLFVRQAVIKLLVVPSTEMGSLKSK